MSIELTERAAEHVRKMLQQRPQAQGLRLGIRKSGCSGFAYVVDYADEITEQDELFESAGVKVVIERESLPYLAGTQVDFVRANALNSGFEFHNPNVRNSCGCGESVSF